MGYHVIMDSVGDRTDELIGMSNFSVAPLRIMINDKEYIDDNSLNQIDMLEKIASSVECPKSSCPTPQTYMELFEAHKGDRIYVIAGSSELTGSFNSAQVAKRMFMESNPQAEIHIFNSVSACAGETLLAYEVIDLESKSMSFENVIDKVNEFISKQQIYFVLEDVSFLEKNGRLTGIKSLLVNMLHIVPILTADSKGIIRQADKARGIKKGISKLIDYVVKGIREGNKKRVVISHCNAYERAVSISEEIKGIFKEIDIKIVATGGVSTLYAGNGGIVISY